MTRKSPSAALDSLATSEAVVLIERVKPYFAGAAPDVQGVALASLVATYLVGHVCPSVEATTRVRETFLRAHIKAVRAFMPIEERMVASQIAEWRRTHKARP